MSLKILVVDDDLESLQSTARILEFADHEVKTATSGKEALQVLQTSAPDLVVTDVRMPGMSGIEFIREFQKLNINLPFLVMTAFGEVQDAVWAMKMGAVDFLTKPFKRQTLLDSVAQVGSRLEKRKPQQLNKVKIDFELLGESKAILELKVLIDQVSRTDASVLILGESGSGKELVARILHAKGPNRNGPFVAVNCAAIPENLLESELFGYEKGAFSGANQAKAGLIESAENGTLLLDEIGDMPLALQPKLLRVLEEQEVRRLGSNQSKKINVRIVAATHQNLLQKVKEQSFRSDLYYRLDVMTLAVPALRERKDDLPLLISALLKKFSETHSKNVTELSPDALQVLLQHTWPGNVRELSNVIERGVVLAAGSTLKREDLPSHLITHSTDHAEVARADSTLKIPLGMSLKQVEDMMIKQVLDATQGDRAEAARLLGVNERTIYRKISKSKED